MNEVTKYQQITIHNNSDHLEDWKNLYFEIEVSTSKNSREAQFRELSRFIEWMINETSNDLKNQWSARLTSTFIDHLKSTYKDDGSRQYSDRSINRLLYHLKTWATWVNKKSPFPLGCPTSKIKPIRIDNLLETEKAISEQQRRLLLDAADMLIVQGGLSKDRNRFKEIKDRPKRKSFRPYRNRAIVYMLIETGMRRAGAVNLRLSDIDASKRRITTTEKGGCLHTYKISKQGMNTINDYIENERINDSKKWYHSNHLFLPSSSVSKGKGYLTNCVINTIWNNLCQSINIKNVTPHSARHAMGRHIMKSELL